MGDTDDVTMGGIAKATGRAVAGGVMDAANGFIDMTGEMGEVLNNIVPYGYITFTPEDGFGWQEQKPTDIPEWQLPTTPRGDSMVEGFGRGITQFIAGMALTRGAGTSIPQIVNRGAVSAMLFDPVDGGLVTMLREFNIGKEFLEVIDSQVPEDAPAYRKLYGRLQNGLEELGFGYLAEGVIQGFKHIARTPDLLQKTKDLIQRIDINVDPNTLGTMGGNITIDMKPERVIDDLGFYSQLREEVGNVKQEKFGSIEQFTNMLKGKVKQEELDWSGLGDAFQGKKFTKQEVIDYLDNNHVELEEIRKKGSRIDDIDDMDNFYEIDLQPTTDEPLKQQIINDRFDALYSDYTGGHDNDNYDIVLTGIANDRFDQLQAENGWDSIVRESKEKEYRANMDAAKESGDPEAMEKVVYMLGNVDRNTIDDEIIKEAEIYYDNDPYYDWSNDEGYSIRGTEDTGLVLYNNIGREMITVNSIAEAEIQMRGALIEDGIPYRDPEYIRPDDDMPALGDNNPPKDNIVEGGPTQWQEYTEKGGTNYREFLIRNKNYEGDPSYVKLKLTPDELEELKILDQKHQKLGNFSKPGEINGEWRRYNQLMEKQGIANSEAKLSEFRASSHWRGENEKNIIFHVRMTDRTGPNGEKVLYVDELQSDWAQQGSNRAGAGNSFKTETGSAEKELIKKKQNELLAEREELFKRENKILNTRNFSSGTINSFDPASNRRYYKDDKWQQDENIEFSLYTDAQKEELNKITEEFNDIQSKAKELENQLNVIGKENVPRGPYVQDTDKWTALAIKRLLRVAVEEGYDSIAFSPGSIHYDRWREDGLFEFYDRKIPSVIKNVMKKNLKIKDYKYERKDLSDVEMLDIAHKAEVDSRISGSNEYTILTPDGKEYEIAKKDRLYITITPEIREKVMKGISLFSAGAIATKAGSEMLEEREPANGY